MLDAPSLQSATLNIHLSETFLPPEYAALFATFVHAISSAALAKLALNISGRVASHGDAVETLSLPSIVALGPMLESLLALRNLRSFTLCSPIVLVRVTDEELERAARNWPLLVGFAMTVNLSGGPSSRPHSNGTGNSKPRVPTTRALYFFWRYCPALRKLVLPLLDVVYVAARDLPPLAPGAGATHPLSELRVLVAERERDKSEGQGELPDGEARALAAYVHRLFPELVLEEGYHQPPKEQGAWCVPLAWRKVFACLEDL
ncbi:hypothetical protein GSI_11851 [Ganoderma sinense ZZ0214-1]|uniref:Uncharacterized protein n=1 Tax=Ganoderma sinense ZZ0214-1 TaxID=1077348 RepID=A0A2G8RX79_9APHY|nr:hypothetical protein GSI_11851 [Ganoderma sinense ZZ0214-1]